MSTLLCKAACWKDEAAGLPNCACSSATHFIALDARGNTTGYCITGAKVPLQGTDSNATDPNMFPRKRSLVELIPIQRPRPTQRCQIQTAATRLRTHPDHPAITLRLQGISILVTFAVASSAGYVYTNNTFIRNVFIDEHPRSVMELHLEWHVRSA